MAHTMELARESIWSVERGTKTLYFILFIFQFLAGMILVCWKTASEYDGWLNITLTTWQDAAPVAITSAASAIVVTEIGRYLMVLARSLEEKLERTRERHRRRRRPHRGPKVPKPSPKSSLSSMKTPERTSSASSDATATQRPKTDRQP